LIDIVLTGAKHAEEWFTLSESKEEVEMDGKKAEKLYFRNHRSHLLIPFLLKRTRHVNIYAT
jgi:hypothetical protein